MTKLTAKKSVKTKSSKYDVSEYASGERILTNATSLR